ncbi:AfsR/SARP family transcriptional regulator [Microtetraspora niveoalba]|uniref:AfsR/SARP family transcriptional regulator n=1 Tax=Microtetraspora niveoalba TaxID=46175 RepID=UPI00082F80DD|nr:AfsR/SARP family transcriptional regulator [Microtetraspora niveoalba]
MNSLFFRLFGHLEVVSEDGGRLDLGSRKQRAVLALLALEPGRIVSLDRLIDEIWADEAPSSATGTLQAYISHLRRILEPGRAPRTPPTVLLTREPGYMLAVAPRQVDLSCFTSWAEEGRRATAERRYAAALETLDRALGIWRGEPLAEFADQGFAQPVIAALAEQRALAAEDRFEARLALGDSGSCVADLERMVEAHPYRERSWGLLVLALYRSGRQADALGALRRVRARLSGELGIEPGPELRRIERAVFDQSASLDHSPTPHLPAPPGEGSVPGESAPLDPPLPHAPAPAAASRTPRPRPEPLIARASHLGRVADRLADVRRGRGGVVLVTGEAGIGKTRFAQSAAEEAEARGISVVWGRCVEDHVALPFWPWLQALRALGERGERAAGILAGERTDGPADPGAALFELYEQVVAALTAADGPTLVVLDDLHAADTSSLRLLGYMAGRLGRGAALVLATLRPEPGADPEQLSETLAALARDPGTERMTLPPFTQEDVQAFLASRDDLVDPAFARVLYRRTGGNPFYLRELIRLLGSEHRIDAAALGVPEGVREVIGRRVARLPDSTRELLGSAAVLGRDVTLDVLEAFTGVPAEEVMARLEPAVATGLLAETPDGVDYRFSHVLVRDALYAGLGRLEKARLHLRAGEALESLPVGGGAARLPILAHHFAMAARIGGAGKAVEYAAAAARQATAQRAYDEAVELWEKALLALGQGDPGRRCRLLVELGRARRDIGDTVRARAAIEEAVEVAAGQGDRAVLVDAVTVFGTLSVWNWRPYGVVDERAVALLEDLLAGPLDDAHRAALLGTLGIELNYGPRRAEGEAMAAEAVEIARRVGDPALLLQVLNNYLIAAWVPAREHERLRAVEEMLAVPRLPASAELVARIQRLHCMFRMGELAEWDRDLARAERLLREVRSSELTAMVRVAEAARLTLEGRWSEAERLVDEMHRIFGAGTIWGLNYVRLSVLYTCRRGQGRVAEILDDMINGAAEPHMEPLRPMAVLAALDAGDRDLAASLITRWGTPVPDDWSGEFAAVVWSYVSVELGVPDPAWLYGLLLPYADRLAVNGSGTAGWGSIHQALARLAAATGDRDAALRHARRALEAHERLRLRHWSEESRRLLADLGG